MKKAKGLLLIGVIVGLLSMSFVGGSALAGQEPDMPGLQVSQPVSF